MDIVDPRVDLTLIPEGSIARVIAEHQSAYRDLPSVITPRGQVITRWSPSDEERQALLRGDDVFITLLSAGWINPMFVTIGPMDWTITEAALQGGTKGGER